MERARQFDIQLTERQQQVWRLVAKGHTNGEIAEKLGITLDGAKWHVGELLTKLGADTREDLVEAWDARRGLLRRAHAVTGGLFGFSWLKAGIATAAVAGTVGAAAVGYQLMSGVSSQAVGPGAELSLLILPPTAVLTEKDARSRAEVVGDQLIATHLPELLVDPQVRIADLGFREGRWLAPGEGYVSLNGMNEWTPEPGITTGAWVFAWIGEDMGRTVNPDAIGDVEVEVVISDQDVVVVMGGRAQLLTSYGAMRQTGFPGGFTSRRDTRFEPVSPVFSVGHLNGDPTLSELLIYQSQDGHWCQWQVNPGGSGTLSCGSFEGATPDRPISYLGGSGVGSRLVGDLMVESEPVLVVRVDPDVASVGVEFADGSSVRFEAVPMPAATGFSFGVAYFSHPKLRTPHSLVGYTSTGEEIDRQGPWLNGPFGP